MGYNYFREEMNMEEKQVIGNNELYIKSISYVAKGKNCLRGNEFTKGIHRNSDLFVYIADGLAEYEFDGDIHTVRSGDLVYISNGCDYNRRILSDFYHIICVDFTFDAPEGTLMSHIFPDMKNMDTYFKRLYKTWNSYETSYRLRSMSILYEIYSKLVWNEASTYIPTEKKDVFNDIIKKMSEDYTDRELSVHELAQMANMSDVHFRKIFKNIYKVSPRQYIIFLRIERAKELLVFDSMSVTAIGDMLGFTDSSHFSRVFKQKTGYNPLEYRKMFKE